MSCKRKRRWIRIICANPIIVCYKCKIRSKVWSEVDMADVNSCSLTAVRPCKVELEFKWAIVLESSQIDGL
jgi:hypothetical protein